MSDQPPPSASTEGQPAKAPEKVISGGDIVGGVVGGVVFLAVIAAGGMNILRGRIWTGVFLIAAPTAVVLITTLPLRIRQRIPESVAAVVTLGLWAGFFWAACGGR